MGFYTAAEISAPREAAHYPSLVSSERICFDRAHYAITLVRLTPSIGSPVLMPEPVTDRVINEETERPRQTFSSGRSRRD